MRVFLYLCPIFCSVLITGGKKSCSQSGLGPQDLVMSGTMNPKYMWYQAGHQIHVPVVMDQSYNHREKMVILNGLQEIQAKTCIEFFVFKNNYSLQGYDHVHITRAKKGCWSYVGRVGGGQELSLPPGCINHRTAVHEMMHALGFVHEHVRSDRDQYILILWGNIERGREHNFEKRRGSSANGSPFGPYDYKSIMHYEKNAFSKNNGDTIRPLKDGVRIGVYKTMSDWDAIKLNRMYKCQGTYSSPGYSSVNSNYLPPEAPETPEEIYPDHQDDYPTVTDEVQHSAPRYNIYDYDIFH